VELIGVFTANTLASRGNRGVAAVTIRPALPALALALTLLAGACSSAAPSGAPAASAPSAAPTTVASATPSSLATAAPTLAPTLTPLVPTAFSEPAIAAGDGMLTVSAVLSAEGAPLAGTPVSMTTSATDRRYAVIELTGTVPASATSVIVGLRFNMEGAGPAPIDMRIYQVTYADGASTKNKVRNSGFDKGFANWSVWGTGYFRTPRSDRGDGRMLRLKTTFSQDIALNADAVKATPGSRFTMRVAAELPRSGTLSGYAAAIFLYGKEIQRQRLELVAPAIPVLSTATDATGSVTFEQRLEPGTYIVEIHYAGGKYAPTSVRREVTID
jgi:hypothetical protein